MKFFQRTNEIIATQTSSYTFRLGRATARNLETNKVFCFAPFIELNMNLNDKFIKRIPSIFVQSLYCAHDSPSRHT